jgi:hypothetical protein
VRSGEKLVDPEDQADRQRTEVLLEVFGFRAACAVGIVVNYAVALLLRSYDMPIQLAASGIAAGMAFFNFVCTRFLVFRNKADNPEFYRSTPWDMSKPPPGPTP